MSEEEKSRLVVWSRELRAVHDRLRGALRVTRDAVRDGGDGEAVAGDLLLYCRGFCTALTAHHAGEDRSLFPTIEAAHPELRDTLRSLQQDHSMIEHLIGGLQAAVTRSASPDELDQHLEGIAAIMESHFRYEERQLLTVLDTLALERDVHEVLGPL